MTSDAYDGEIAPGISAPLDVDIATTPAPAAPARQPRGGRRTAVVTAVALGVAAGGGAIAFAAGGHGNGSAGGGPRGGAGGPGGPGGGFGGGFPGGGYGAPGAPGAPGGTGPGRAAAAGDVVHGTFVVVQRPTSGTAGTATETDDVQRGTVTAVGGGSVTVRSADGFTKTYVFGSAARVDGGRGTASEVRTGDTVSLVATESGAAATVTSLVDRTRGTAPTPPAGGTSPEATAPSAAPTAGSGKGDGAPPAGAGGFGPGAGGDDPVFRALHGTYVVARTSGTTTTYATDVVQTGSVTALSATSIALRSTDGYTATYVITSATTKDSSVATGRDATVTATGTPATATAVRTAGGRADGGGHGPGGGRLPDGGMPGGAAGTST